MEPDLSSLFIGGPPQSVVHAGVFDVGAWVAGQLVSVRHFDRTWRPRVKRRVGGQQPLPMRNPAGLAGPN